MVRTWDRPIVANEGLEVIGNELRAIVAADSRRHTRVLFRRFGDSQLVV